MVLLDTAPHKAGLLEPLNILATNQKQTFWPSIYSRLLRGMTLFALMKLHQTVAAEPWTRHLCMRYVSNGMDHACYPALMRQVACCALQLARLMKQLVPAHTSHFCSPDFGTYTWRLILARIPAPDLGTDICA